jgi:hypothetical protein
MSVCDLALYITQSIVNIIGHLLVKQMAILKVGLYLQISHHLLSSPLSLPIFAALSLTRNAVREMSVQRQNLVRQKLTISVTLEVLFRKML